MMKLKDLSVLVSTPASSITEDVLYDDTVIYCTFWWLERKLMKVIQQWLQKKWNQYEYLDVSQIKFYFD